MRPFDPRLLRYASAARGYLIGTVALGLVTTALVVAQASLLARALAGAARGTGLPALSGTVAVLLLVVIARAAAAFGGEAAALHAAATVKSQLRRRLAEHALRLGPAWLSGQQAGEITALTTKGLDALDPYFARYLPQLLLACLVPLAVLTRVAAADWISGLIIVATLPLIPVFAILVGRYAQARTRQAWGLLSRLGGHFLDVVDGLTTLKLFGRAKAQAEVIRTVTAEHRTATMAALRVAFLSALVLELAAALATALVAVEVGLRLLAGHIGYQTALLVLLLTPEAYLPLRNVGAQFHASVEGTNAAGRVFEILDHPARPEQRPQPATRLTAQADPDLRHEPITLTAVTLTYPGRCQALTAVSGTIRPGERIVVTGPSGSGKSSLLSLLLRFTACTSGFVEVAGTDIGALPLGPWRRQIAWVPQSPYLFAATVAENIALGDPAASLDDIRRAAELAGAEQFIGSLPDGYQTRLAERALNLSAGQRQRLALARAFLRDAPLLLLDEPTAHLDSATASDIMAAIETLMTGRTVVLVTHTERLPFRTDQAWQLTGGRLARGPGTRHGDGEVGLVAAP
jgi:ATP-binding cassette, subfamily C, bacterial CydD